MGPSGPITPIPAEVHEHYPNITQQAWDALSPAEQTKMAGSAAVETKSPGFFSTYIAEPADAAFNFAKKVLYSPEALTEQIAGGDNGPPTKTKAKAKKKPPAEGDLTTAQMEAQIQQGDLWNQLGQQLVSDQAKLSAPVENAISGGLTAPVASGAATQALSDMGLSPNSKASDWLNSEIAQAKANDAPLTQAMKEYGADYAQGQQGVSAALAGMGQANALAIDTAPEADWMTAIVQHAMSNVNYYGEITPSQASTLPPSVLAALSGSGGGGEAAAGSIPITDTPSQIAAAVQNYYAHGATSSGLPSSTTAAAGATASGISGLPPTASNAAGT